MSGEEIKIREGRRYALPRRESYMAMTDEDRTRIEAINASLKQLAERPTSSPVLITYWVDDSQTPLERFVIASHVLPNATRLIPTPSEWAWRATHITIDAPEWS